MFAWRRIGASATIFVDSRNEQRLQISRFEPTKAGEHAIDVFLSELWSSLDLLFSNSDQMKNPICSGVLIADIAELRRENPCNHKRHGKSQKISDHCHEMRDIIISIRCGVARRSIKIAYMLCARSYTTFFLL